ncbi:FtsX-like permease family protein [Nocardioides sp. zg-536]|uniref:Cell division protein FtsX n=1 Tax=Nocardioides faecalis TaxID=2803858 RepID=A0A939BWP1_9ACTN|nr:permease-like cell division protein FtsX [Nocardioides faecalis]MBM9460842.1 FtsX-like permease family protein [Nocardioides faecalis]MBS4754709.1 permease-like cell division protein FtsX [Nocardioides faecalis]QVI58029.1 permease-like cell division protein FtsX [Nocardioides faecalis]
MQLRYVFTELRTGLRRNLSMHLAVILTLFVSLSLAGVGILIQREADLASEKLGDELKILVNLCITDDPSNNPNCASGEVTAEQQERIEKEIEDNDEVESFRFLSKEEGFANAVDSGQIPESAISGPDPVITVEDWPKGYWVTLKTPEKADGIISALEGLDGVSGIKDQRKALGQIFGIMKVLKYGSWIGAGFLLLAALLQVTNTIRLAALARRREIAIMRLVGASTLYITLPFLLEALVTAVIGVVLATGALAAFQYWGIEKGVAEQVEFLPWIGWDDYAQSLIGYFPPGIPGIFILGPALTLIPTLLLTRKYVKV